MKVCSLCRHTLVICPCTLVSIVAPPADTRRPLARAPRLLSTGLWFPCVSARRSFARERWSVLLLPLLAHVSQLPAHLGCSPLVSGSFLLEHVVICLRGDPCGNRIRDAHQARSHPHDTVAATARPSPQQPHVSRYNAEQEL